MGNSADSATPTGDYAVGFGGQTPYHFTVLPAATAVPEPSGAVPLAVAAAFLLVLRVRRRGSRR